MRVRAGDVRLAVEVYGEEWVAAAGDMRRRPVLVGVHGGPGLDATLMRRWLAPLADTAQVVVPELRGHGRSDLGAPASWNLTTWAADLRRLFDTLGIHRPVLLGSSFGGFVAQRYAATYPDALAGLVLASTAPRLASMAETAARVAELAGAASAAEVVERHWTAPDGRTAADWDRVVGPLLSLRPDPARIRLNPLRIHTPQVNRHFMAPGGEAHRMDLRPALGAVRCPTLVLVGERDPLLPVRLAGEIVEALPPGLGRLRIVPAAAHELFDDNPAEVGDLVRAFLGHV